MHCVPYPDKRSLLELSSRLGSPVTRASVGRPLPKVITPASFQSLNILARNSCPRANGRGSAIHETDSRFR